MADKTGFRLTLVSHDNDEHVRIVVEDDWHSAVVRALTYMEDNPELLRDTKVFKLTKTDEVI